MTKAIHTAKALSRNAKHPSDDASINSLADSIAEELRDRANLPTYQLLCSEYSEKVIHKAKEHTLAVPPEKVKRSRLALFIYLVKKYARDSE